MLPLRCMFIGTYHVQLRDLIFQTAIAFANAYFSKYMLLGVSEKGGDAKLGAHMRTCC